MADDLDVLTIDEAKAAINNNAGTGNDTLLAAYVTGVSRYLDEICGPIVVRDIDDELKDGGYPEIFTDERPVASVTSVTEYAGIATRALTEQTVGTAPSEGYVVHLKSGRISRVRSSFRAYFAHGQQNIQISYTAGRYDDTASVDPRFKQAAGIILANMWRREHGLGTVELPVGATYALPNAAKSLLATDLLIRA